MTERLITHLRHVDLAVPDYGTQRDFYLDLWGLTEVAKDGDLSYLAAEGSTEPFVVRLRKSADKRIDLIGIGAADKAAVDQLAAQLGTAGVQLISEPGDLSTFGGGYGFRCFDGDGRTLEVSCDVEAARGPRDRAARVDPGGALARGAQLARPGGHGRLVHAAPRRRDQRPAHHARHG